MLVIDCSVVMAGLLPDETSAYAARVLELLMAGQEQGTVAALFYLEASNVLEMLCRRGRLSDAAVRACLLAIGNLPLRLDTEAIRFTQAVALRELMQNTA